MNGASLPRELDIYMTFPTALLFSAEYLKHSSSQTTSVHNTLEASISK